LVLQACIYHALIKLTPSLLLILLSPCSLIFSSLHYSALYYIHIQMSCFSIFHSLFCLLNFLFFSNPQ
jgi:hypothetical protein